MPWPLDARGLILGAGWDGDLLLPALALVLGWLLLAAYAWAHDRRYPCPGRVNRDAALAEALRPVAERSIAIPPSVQGNRGRTRD
jgi:hypothetical protein